MKIPPWYVMTGGTSSGKTTLLEKLEKLGYYVVKEASRVLIDECRAKGISTKELRKDEGSFQQRVLQIKLEIEEKTPKDRVVFFERAIPDSIAYYKVCGLDAQEIEKISRNRYKKIFFLEQLPFQQDYARTEDETTVRKLNQLLLKSYKNLGYEVVFVPAVSIEERLKLVLAHLKHTPTVENKREKMDTGDKDVIEGTLCWIFKNGKALLQLAKRGISEGKWNAVGGKVEHGETPLECVKREVLEETGLALEELIYHGKLRFFYGEKTWVTHIFSTDKFTGGLKESESDGKLEWFSLDDLPFDKMWQDDTHWVPLLLEGKHFDGEFFFSGDGNELLKHELHII